VEYRRQKDRRKDHHLMVLLLAPHAGLFARSFLAATVLPLSSDAPLAALVGVRGQLVAPVLVATAVNALGACTTYWLVAGHGRSPVPTKPREKGRGRHDCSGVTADRRCCSL